MAILVTGGAGYIGRWLANELVDAGHEVVALDTQPPPEGMPPRLPSSATWVKGDVTDKQSVAEAVKLKPLDAIIHLAGIVTMGCERDPDLCMRVNLGGTSNLLEAARKYHDRLTPERRRRFRFVHVSTDEVYGSLGATGLFCEETPYQPSSPYSASKAASDHLAHAWSKTYGLPVIVSNCSNNYGPYQFPEKLIPLIILNAIEGKPLPVYGNGSNVRDWLYVDDHAEGLISLLKRGRPGEKYNFGGNSERSNLDVVELICDVLDQMVPGRATRRSLITFVKDRPGHDLRYAIDASKARHELGWKPSKTFEEGIAQTVQWYLESRAWWEATRFNVYGGARLGLPEMQH